MGKEMLWVAGILGGMMLAADSSKPPIKSKKSNPSNKEMWEAAEKIVLALIKIKKGTFTEIFDNLPSWSHIGDLSPAMSELHSLEIIKESFDSKTGKHIYSLNLSKAQIREFLHKSKKSNTRE